MTLEEFDNTKFHADMQCIYKSRTRDVVSVDFEEKLLALVNESDPDLWDWVRCENIVLIVELAAPLPATTRRKGETVGLELKVSDI